MKTKDIVNISLFVTLLAVCAWICIPTMVPFTMQTFAVFLAMIVLGGKKGTLVIGIYLILGTIGIPVFSRGTAGIGMLLGATGGYMLGWLLLGGIMMVTDKIKANRKWVRAAGLGVGLAASYLLGTIWFVTVYGQKAGVTSFGAALGMCVVPFIIPDLIKMILAFAVSKRIKNIITNV